MCLYFKKTYVFGLIGLLCPDLTKYRPVMSILEPFGPGPLPTTMAEAPYVDHYHLNATGDVVCDAEGSGDLVVLGILIGLIASVGINIGQNLQSLGMKACGQSKPHTNRTCHFLEGASHCSCKVELALQ